MATSDRRDRRDARHEQHEDRKHEAFDRDDAPSSEFYILDRLNDLFLKVFGSAARQPREAHDSEHSELVQRWHREVQEHFLVEKDEHGNEYLYLRDGFHDDTDTGSSRN